MWLNLLFDYSAKLKVYLYKLAGRLLSAPNMYPLF